MVDLSAIAKWPNVPACYEWLSLDRRGDWRLQGERVLHHGFVALLNRQYGVDDRGCWFVQNGPQRVFVTLAYTPWVFRREDDAFVSHNGEASGAIRAIFLDDDGNILLDTELGIGLLDDRDLPAFLGECRGIDDQAVDESAFVGLMSGIAGQVFWQKQAIQPILAVDVEKRFKFKSWPKP